MAEESTDWVQLTHLNASKRSTDSSLCSEAGEPPPWLINVQDFASRSADRHLGSGDHLECFAQYLKRPYDPTFCSTEATGTQERDFAVLLDFQSNCIKRVFRKAAELDEIKAQSTQPVAQSQLLIIRGHPSPEWLNAIASAFDVDVEFLYHHLELFSRKQGDPAWTWPPLSSTLAREPRLRITSLGTVNKPKHNAREEKHVNLLRSQARKKFKTYLEEVQRETNVCVGTSLLRDIRVHSAGTFSFEQDVSIWTQQLGHGWRGVAWIDVGIDDLFHGPQGDALRSPLGGRPEDTIFGSTVFCRASENEDLARERTFVGGKDILDTPDGITQNARHLFHQYEHSLDPTLARADSFYALSNMFAFCAASENHFLNMMRSVIRDDIHHATVLAKEERADASLSNLLYNQLVLSEHVGRLEENILAIQERHQWPKLRSSTEDTLAQADRAGVEMLANYQGLLRRAKSLAADCDRGIRRIEHLKSFAESKRAMAQAEGVANLARLGAVFVPLSFSCAFFGMNFQENGQGTMSLWVWGAVTLPILVLTLILVSTELRRKLGRCIGLYSKRAEEQDREFGKEDMC